MRVDNFILDCVIADCCEMCSCAGDFSGFHAAQLHGIITALGFSNEVNMLHGALIECDCSIRIILTDRRRDKEAAREFDINRHFGVYIKFLCEIALAVGIVNQIII